MALHLIGLSPILWFQEEEEECCVIDDESPNCHDNNTFSNNGKDGDAGHEKCVLQSILKLLSGYRNRNNGLG